jgi:hypothetical protein
LRSTSRRRAVVVVAARAAPDSPHAHPGDVAGLLLDFLVRLL